ncbi:MAG: hypothetical protein AAF340_03700 [Pseudomonadota bacterium]
MLGDIRIFLFLALLGAGVIFSIFQAPPLTSRETGATALVDQSSFEAVFDDELDHCEAQPNSYDCQCYARISGVVQSGEGFNVAGVQRIDRKQLARMQASGSC